MYKYYHYGSDVEIDDKETAFTCPECGEKKDIDYNEDQNEYACLCNICGNMWDFYKVKEI